MPDPALYERLRLHGAARSALIAYGIAAYSLIFPQAPAWSGHMFLTGVGLQLLVLIARKVGGRLSPLALFVFELVSDGVTVLLFALGTFRGIAERIGSF